MEFILIHYAIYVDSKPRGAKANYIAIDYSIGLPIMSITGLHNLCLGTSLAAKKGQLFLDALYSHGLSPLQVHILYYFKIRPTTKRFIKTIITKATLGQAFREIMCDGAPPGRVRQGLSVVLNGLR